MVIPGERPKHRRRIDDRKAEIRRQAVAARIDPNTATTRLLELSWQERATRPAERHARRWDDAG
jgi:hypothetical protein